MIRTSNLLLAVSLAVLLGGAAYAESPCERPLVSKKSVAIGIFNSIAGGLESPRTRRKYVIETHDDGTSWSVFQALRGGDSYREYTDSKGRRMEAIQMTTGGGGLGMSIDKCTGAISGVAWQR